MYLLHLVVSLLSAPVACCGAFTIPNHHHHRHVVVVLQPHGIVHLSPPTTIATTQLHGSYFDDEDEQDREFSRIRGGGRNRRILEKEELEELDTVVDDYYNTNELEDDDYQGVIPNPLLDNIDPEGSAERLGELFSDRQFWIDIGLLLLFLNFLDNLRDPAVFDAIDMATM